MSMQVGGGAYFLDGNQAVGLYKVESRKSDHLSYVILHLSEYSFTIEGL